MLKRIFSPGEGIRNRYKTHLYQVSQISGQAGLRYADDSHDLAFSAGVTLIQQKNTSDYCYARSEAVYYQA